MSGSTACERGEVGAPRGRARRSWPASLGRRASPPRRAVGARCRHAAASTSGRDLAQRLEARRRPAAARAARGRCTSTIVLGTRRRRTARRRGRRRLVAELRRPPRRSWSAARRPARLALVTAIGPVLRSSSIATGCSGMRTATVPPASPRSHARRLVRTTRVSAPGQNASTRSRAALADRMARPSTCRGLPTSTGTGMSRPRPLAASSRGDRRRAEGVGSPMP